MWQNTFSVRGRWVGLGGKIIPRIRLTSAKVLVKVEAEHENINNRSLFHCRSVKKQFFARIESFRYPIL